LALPNYSTFNFQRQRCDAPTKAARWLGISRLTLRKKLIQFGLHQV
jgi:DNA-binding protein Fis